MLAVIAKWKKKQQLLPDLAFFATLDAVFLHEWPVTCISAVAVASSSPSRAVAIFVITWLRLRLWLRLWTAAASLLAILPYPRMSAVAFESTTEDVFIAAFACCWKHTSILLESLTAIATIAFKITAIMIMNIVSLIANGQMIMLRSPQ